MELHTLQRATVWGDHPLAWRLENATSCDPGAAGLSRRGAFGGGALRLECPAAPGSHDVTFSSLPFEDAQTQCAVGVGALAGSTIMLLTLPWFLAVFAGRVPIENGKPNYKSDEALRRQKYLYKKSAVTAWRSSNLAAVCCCCCCCCCCYCYCRPPPEQKPSHGMGP